MLSLVFLLATYGNVVVKMLRVYKKYVIFYNEALRTIISVSDTCLRSHAVLMLSDCTNNYEVPC